MSSRRILSHVGGTILDWQVCEFRGFTPYLWAEVVKRAPSVLLTSASGRGNGHGQHKYLDEVHDEIKSMGHRTVITDKIPNPNMDNETRIRALLVLTGRSERAKEPLYYINSHCCGIRVAALSHNKLNKNSPKKLMEDIINEEHPHYFAAYPFCVPASAANRVIAFQRFVRFHKLGTVRTINNGTYIAGMFTWNKNKSSRTKWAQHNTNVSTWRWSNDLII